MLQSYILTYSTCSHLKHECMCTKKTWKSIRTTLSGCRKIRQNLREICLKVPDDRRNAALIMQLKVFSIIYFREIIIKNCCASKPPLKLFLRSSRFITSRPEMRNETGLNQPALTQQLRFKSMSRYQDGSIAKLERRQTANL